MRIERITGPIEAGLVDRLIAAGRRTTVQFPAAGLLDSDLDLLNALCERHGAALEVRFYGRSKFDCRALRRLPAVSALVLDDLDDADHLEELFALQHLRRLSIGIDALDDPGFLAAPAFRELEQLSVGPTERGNLSLAPVAQMQGLRWLSLSQATDIRAVGGCAHLRELELVGLAPTVRLDFVNGLRELRVLRVGFGARDAVSEIRHAALAELEVRCVRGLASLRPGDFPALRKLELEDQLQLETLEFTEQRSQLEHLRIVNSQRLRRLGGLGRLRELRSLQLEQTAVDFEELVADGLPPRLLKLQFGTGKKRQDAVIQAMIQALGYRA